MAKTALGKRGDRNNLHKVSLALYLRLYPHLYLVSPLVSVSPSFCRLCDASERVQKKTAAREAGRLPETWLLALDCSWLAFVLLFHPLCKFWFRLAFWFDFDFDFARCLARSVWGEECLFSFSINRPIIALRGGLPKASDRPESVRVKAAVKLSHFTRRVKTFPNWYIFLISLISSNILIVSFVYLLQAPTWHTSKGASINICGSFQVTINPKSPRNECGSPIPRLSTWVQPSGGSEQTIHSP